MLNYFFLQAYTALFVLSADMSNSQSEFCGKSPLPGVGHICCRYFGTRCYCQDSYCLFPVEFRGKCQLSSSRYRSTPIFNAKGYEIPVCTTKKQGYIMKYTDVQVWSQMAFTCACSDTLTDRIIFARTNTTNGR